MLSAPGGSNDIVARLVASLLSGVRKAVSATPAKPMLQAQFQKAGATTLELSPEKLGQLTASDLNR